MDDQVKESDAPPPTEQDDGARESQLTAQVLALRSAMAALGESLCAIGAALAGGPSQPDSQDREPLRDAAAGRPSQEEPPESRGVDESSSAAAMPDDATPPRRDDRGAPDAGAMPADGQSAPRGADDSPSDPVQQQSAPPDSELLTTLAAALKQALGQMLPSDGAVATPSAAAPPPSSNIDTTGQLSEASQDLLQQITTACQGLLDLAQGTGIKVDSSSSAAWGQ